MHALNFTFLGGRALRVRLVAHLGSVTVGKWRVCNGAQHGLLLGCAIAARFGIGVTNWRRLVGRRSIAIVMPEDWRGRRVNRELMGHDAAAADDQIVLDARSLHLIIFVRAVGRIDAVLIIVKMKWREQLGSLHELVGSFLLIHAFMICLYYLLERKNNVEFA